MQTNLQAMPEPDSHNVQDTVNGRLCDDLEELWVTELIPLTDLLRDQICSRPVRLRIVR